METSTSKWGDVDDFFVAPVNRCSNERHLLAFSFIGSADVKVRDDVSSYHVRLRERKVQLPCCGRAKFTSHVDFSGKSSALLALAKRTSCSRGWRGARKKVTQTLTRSRYDINTKPDN